MGRREKLKTHESKTDLGRGDEVAILRTSGDSHEVYFGYKVTSEKAGLLKVVCQEEGIEVTGSPFQKATGKESRHISTRHQHIISISEASFLVAEGHAALGEGEEVPALANPDDFVFSSDALLTTIDKMKAKRAAKIKAKEEEKRKLFPYIRPKPTK